MIKILSILLALIFQSQIIYSQSSWFWQNPYPLNNNLNAVKFFDENTGIACGDNGSIIQTTDGGLSWKISYVPERNNLKAIYFVDEQTGFIVPGNTQGNVYTPYIQRTTNGGQSWQAKNTGQLIFYTGVYFVNKNTGYACGEYGKVIKTTDSGENWNLILEYAGTLYAISFPAENIGYLLGNNSAVLKTTNAGLNWSEVTRIPVNNARSIFFTNDTTGYSVGDVAGLYKTTNGGINWFSQGSFTGKQIYFVNQNKGWTVGSSGNVHFTINGGNNWYSANSVTSFESNSINFGDETTGFMVGNNGKIMKTEIGGFIWNLISSNFVSYNLYGMSFINSSTGFFLGGGLWRTTNKGINWTSIPVSSGYLLYQVSFINESTGYLVADSVVFKGRLYKSTNGGNNWSIIYSVTSYIVGSVFFTDPDNGYITIIPTLHTQSKILKTTNGGSTWQEVFVGPDNLRNLYFANPNTGFCIDGNGLNYKTTDMGNSWSPEVPIPFYKMFFTSSLIGYAVGTGGAAYKTTNGGANWLTLNTGISSAFSMMNLHFTNENTGFAIGYELSSPYLSVIINTTNGGDTWFVVDSTHYNGLNSIWFINPTVGFIVGKNGLILKTTNGGLTFTNSNSEELPREFYLSQNYPNPFNPSTTISYSVDKAAIIKLKVFDINGKEVRTLLDEIKQPGQYEIIFNGSGLPSGVYFYRLTLDSFEKSNNFVQTKRMVLIK